jgi:hypothetical protein
MFAMLRPRRRWLFLLIAAGAVAWCAPTSERQWLAGDSHVHSHWSAGYDRRQSPPVVLKGQDALYSTPRNAVMGRRFGLRWMVTTDHGGPNHAKFSLSQAYRELTLSRELVPAVLQFYGMELNMPGMDHHTLISPYAEDAASVLYEIEHRFDANEAWALPPDLARRTEAARRSALEYMTTLTRLPILFANHPSRSARAIGVYGLDEPWEIRTNNDLAPSVYRGMEGAPGHQATTLAPDGTPRRDGSGRLAGARGNYRNIGAGTFGGFDQMTAIVGGLWDTLLGEGRRFWIVATSDSHVHYTESVRRGSDFWPGEFHKTYVRAHPTYEDVLDGLRSGRIFAAAGDLVTELDVVATASGGSAAIGGTLQVALRERVDITIRFRDPDTPNVHEDNPTVHRVDLILGEVQGPLSDRTVDRNPTTRVIARFTGREWTRDGDRYSVATTLPAIDRDVYIRVRGTSTQDTEPRMDTPGEDPWADLWFYSNPIFIEVE